MEKELTHIDGLYIINPLIYEDCRGTFYESYSKKKFQQINLNYDFVQDNESFNNKKGTIRGFHYQIKDGEQAKLVRVPQGSIFAVCVDLRKNSKTYKQYFGIELSSNNHKQILIPRGCAWGFQTLLDNTIVNYKLDNFYNSEYERGIIYNDPVINVDWPIKDNVILSDKDLNQCNFNNLILDVLVIGSNGQLGYDVCNLLKSTNYFVKAPTKDELDIRNKKQVEKYITNMKPDVIINCAAYTDVEKAELEERKLCYDINVNGVKNLINAAKKVNSKFIHISSDYVFDGKNKELYSDDDETNPINYYGLTKKEGEEITRSYKKHFILRTSWLFGVNGKNFVKSMINLSKMTNDISVVDDQIGSPTYSKDLAAMILAMIKTEKYGTYNVTNSGVCSWNEFANTIFKVFGINSFAKKISTKDYKDASQQLAHRPLNSKLNKDKLIKEFFSLPPWKDALERYKDDLVEYQKKQDITIN